MGELQAIHQLGINNKLADYLSHNHLDPTEWYLSPLIAQHLFQTQTPSGPFHLSPNHQLPLWFCRNGHPLAAASNTLSQPWIGLSLYAYPPIPLLERTLIKIREDQVEAIITAPCWLRRSWYHLLQMAGETPLLLPRRRNLLSQCLPNQQGHTLPH